MALELIRWDNKLATGIDWQDTQHQQLLDQLYQLYYALLEGDAKEQLPHLIQFLDRYVKEHFGMEADSMRQYDFYGTDAHLEQHTIFHNRLQEMKHHIEDTGSSSALLTAATFCSELNNWFVEHIGSYDQELGQFLRKEKIS